MRLTKWEIPNIHLRQWKLSGIYPTLRKMLVHISESGKFPAYTLGSAECIIQFIENVHRYFRQYEMPKVHVGQ
jgi:hypothetical protein